ncbi:hypothetical protein HMPREF0063_12654 [Aeromicrobium marinum DSM 15272]|uniref:Uncharacterized protein n=1 Tax=Aeromicrobium marinum DSM 15272 TaxID=585531 RepID=E2SF45_9ACTN|nr:hypothetical protein [Aeromicrobium marinum]EFQ82130.1 hypothetical protein HMPREF0063_12654 [Aeromicrobium marinum DSM 15272]
MSDEFCSYAEFGKRFFAAAVTSDKILGAVAALGGRPIAFGPMGVGPGRLAKVTATGEIGTATAQEVPGREISFDVTLPVALDFALDLQVETHHFHGALELPLKVRARATPDLRIVVEVTPPSARDVRLDLTADGRRAGMVKKLAGVDAEVKRFVAKYVARELEKPEIARARIVDVNSAIDAAWAGLAPR